MLLNLCIDYIRQHGLQRRIGVFHMDYEIQYRDTLDYVNRTLAANADILDVYRVCIPFKYRPVLRCSNNTGGRGTAPCGTFGYGKCRKEA